MESFLTKVRRSIFENGDWSKDQLMVLLASMILVGGKSNNTGWIVKRSDDEIAMLTNFANILGIETDVLEKAGTETKYIMFEKDDSNPTSTWILEHCKTDTMIKYLKETTKMDGRHSSHQAFLAGIFIAKGSINSPESRHSHLELRLNDEEVSAYIVGLLKELDITTVITRKGTNHNILIKRKNVIPDFLKLVKAYDAMFEFENVRSEVETNNTYNRYNVIDQVNFIKRSSLHEKFATKVEQLKTKGKFEKLKEHLKDFVKLKLDNPELSYNELVEQYNEEYNTHYSKSAIFHWINEILNYES